VDNAATGKKGGEASLWVSAIGFSVLLHIIIFTWVSYEVITSETTKREAIPKPKPPEQVLTIYPEMIKVEPVAPKVETAKPELSLTKPDQESAEPPASRRYIGERNTEATSDKVPDANAPEMPSQAGRDPREMEQPETIDNDYRDGVLKNEIETVLPDQLVPPIPPTELSPLSPAPEIVKGTTNPDPSEDEKPQTAIREKLFDGPNPFETTVPEAAVSEDIKPRQEQKTRDGDPEGLAEKEPAEKPKETARPRPAPIDDPAFRGNQSKTAIQGSISRTGRSALDVADTPMGRYQAKISRAVELEWQRNCVRHRDFITPGYLTVRFYVEADGTVKSVNFVGDIQTGEVQKGFTLNSIREAPIPAMPADVKKEMAGDALELIFNFYF